MTQVMKMDLVHTAIEPFWAALTDPCIPGIRVVDFGAYKELHLRVMKTCLPKNQFDVEQAEKASANDWKEDLTHHAHNSGTLYL
eukprot:SAG31_NODE_1003_length_10447_cov_3.491593_13_plen_84_part_00